MKTFSERIRRRLDIWWAVPGGLLNPAAWRRPLHRFVDTHRLRSRAWPMTRWRCCAAWQRCLSNKWNAREFAAMHGVRVPDLYWYGRRPHRLPIADLPPRFVVRRAWGSLAGQTHLLVDGRELLEDRACSPRQLRSDLRRKYGAWTEHPLLVEEFLAENSGGARPIEYNFYCFGAHVGMIEHFEPVGRTSHRCAYDADWRPFPEVIYTGRPRAQPIAAPPRLDELRAVASRLGAAYGTFVRVDLYLTDQGVHFGEFSSTPFNGRHILPWANILLGAMWEEHCPGAV